MYNKIESSHTCKKLDFLKLNCWMNNNNTNSLEEKSNFVKIKINN